MKKFKMSKEVWFVIISVVLCLLSMAFFMLTDRNVKLINDIKPSFCYIDTSNAGILLPSEQSVHLKFRNNHVKIKDSFQYQSIEDCYTIVMAIKNSANESGIEITRSNTEMVGELRLHNFLYRVGYKPDETGDADLEYIKDRRWYVNIASRWIGWTGI